MQRFLRHLPPVWLAALGLALGLVVADAFYRSCQVEAVSAIRGEMVEPPALDPYSPTGYALGCRQLIVPASGGDSYAWIIQTQEMLAEHTWRIRRAEYDNFPNGRDVHWASPYRWWIGFLAWINHACSGRPLGAAVEQAALQSNPPLFAALLLVTVPVVARRFGSFAATVLALGLAVAFPFNLYLATDYPDHHGILQACGMLLVLFLLAAGGGLVRARATAGATSTKLESDATGVWWLTRQDARRWFIASAVAGGIGMWVSAASVIPVFVGLGIGILWAGWLARHLPTDSPVQNDPTLWRVWGRAGAAVSLLAYVLEYFPAHLGWRLEVNHPVYALAWAGAGEALCYYFKWMQSGRLPRARQDVLPLVVGLLGIGLAPAIILCTRERTFAVLDRYVWDIGAQYVAEGESLVLAVQRHGFSWLLVVHLVPMVLILLPLALLARRMRQRLWSAQFALGAAPTLFFLLLTVREIRWWGIAVGLLFATLAPVFASWTFGTPRERRLGRWATALAALLLLPSAIDMVQAMRHPESAAIRQLVERDVAQWLRQRQGPGHVVVASTPGLTTNLMYFGSCDGLGTLYWENTDGLKRVASLFAASTADEAFTVVQQSHVTHIVLPTWDHFAENLARFYRGRTRDQPVPEDAFVVALLRGHLPDWLRPIPYRLPPAEALRNEHVLVLEVVPRQSPALRAKELMEYFLEMNETETPACTAVANEMEKFPDDLAALVTLTHYYGRTGQTDACANTLERVRAHLADADRLEPSDQIRLAVALAAGGQSEEARERLHTIATTLDEAHLRQLTSDPLGDLLRLCSTFHEGIADPHLRQLAPKLYPPMLR